jgi:hypothetical protein
MAASEFTQWPKEKHRLPRSRVSLITRSTVSVSCPTDTKLWFPALKGPRFTSWTWRWTSQSPSFSIPISSILLYMLTFLLRKRTVWLETVMGRFTTGIRLKKCLIKGSVAMKDPSTRWGITSWATYWPQGIRMGISLSGSDFFKFKTSLERDWKQYYSWISLRIWF